MSVDNFPEFARLVHDHFKSLTNLPTTPVFVTAATRDDLWDEYLRAFPEGTNPIFRQRTEHDCSCCRAFVKGIGGLVTLAADGGYNTVWDYVAVTLPGTYGEVARHMAAFLRSKPLEGIYLSTEHAYGAEVTYEKVEGSPDIAWRHFHGKVPAHLHNADPGTLRGKAASAHQVLGRGLAELTLGALETVEELITSNSLYRGEEHLHAVQGFLALKRAHDDLPAEARPTFVWRHIKQPAALFRNTAIGTLVQDLSEGMDLNAAVGRFESKVAPANYRRTSAPITPAMIDKALGELRGLGLESAVHRRFAVIGDVSVNDVLFVDRGVRPHMKDALADALMTAVRPATVSPMRDGTIAVSGDEFMASILPGATSIDLQLDVPHLGNFVSLTAPQADDVGRLFTWDNNFAWVYDGDVTDGIKQRVKKAGGNVEALLRVSLSWRNYDDLDLHAVLPDGSHVYYVNKMGILDVDMNAGGGSRGNGSREPVENLAFTQLRDGTYAVSVNQYRQVEATDFGFEVEYEHRGDVRRYHYGKLVRGNVPVLTLRVHRGEVIEVTPSKEVEVGSVTAEKWGLKTGTTVPVDTVVLSPNHWGPPEHRSGNKHHIFVLRGCINPNRVRGFFNEFLRPELHAHRKVFEVLGTKTLCPTSEHQLSGVGFSSTRHDRATFVVRKDGTTRTYDVQF